MNKYSACIFNSSGAEVRDKHLRGSVKKLATGLLLIGYAALGRACSIYSSRYLLICARREKHILFSWSSVYAVLIFQFCCERISRFGA